MNTYLSYKESKIFIDHLKNFENATKIKDKNIIENNIIKDFNSLSKNNKILLLKSNMKSSNTILMLACMYKMINFADKMIDFIKTTERREITDILNIKNSYNKTVLFISIEYKNVDLLTKLFVLIFKNENEILSKNLNDIISDICKDNKLFKSFKENIEKEYPEYTYLVSNKQICKPIKYVKTSEYVKINKPPYNNEINMDLQENEPIIAEQMPIVYGQMIDAFGQPIENNRINGFDYYDYNDEEMQDYRIPKRIYTASRRQRSRSRSNSATPRRSRRIRTRSRSTSMSAGKTIKRKYKNKH